MNKYRTNRYLLVEPIVSVAGLLAKLVQRFVHTRVVIWLMQLMLGVGLEKDVC